MNYTKQDLFIATRIMGFATFAALALLVCVTLTGCGGKNSTVTVVDTERIEALEAELANQVALVSTLQGTVTSLQELIANLELPTNLAALAAQIESLQETLLAAQMRIEALEIEIELLRQCYKKHGNKKDC